MLACLTDGREDKGRKRWGVRDDCPPFLLFEIEGEREFRNAGFIERFIVAYHSSVLVLCADILPRDVEKVETHLGMRSEVPHGFMACMDFSGESVKLVLETIERFAKFNVWNEWGVGFLRRESVSEVLQKCKDQEYPMAQLWKSGRLDYLIIRDFDSERLSIFTFREATFIEIQSMIESEFQIKHESWGRHQ